jgi:hypothetical protein
MSLIDIDPWLKPHKAVISARERYMKKKTEEVLGDTSLASFALGFQHFGLHKTDDGWIFREWAPNATKIVLVGDFTDWQELDEFILKRTKNGQWHGKFPLSAMKHGQKYKLRIYWDGGDSWRIPSYATRVVQDPETHDFSAEVWAPAKDFIAKREAPAFIANDGKQTPMRGHPVFIAQHATATCCRECIRKWHKMQPGRELSQVQQDYLVDIIMTWIQKELERQKKKL